VTAKIPEGCILLARKTMGSEIWNKKPAWWFKVWCYILLKVNHKDNAYFKRGENFFNTNQIYRDCNLVVDGIKPVSVRNVTEWFKLHGQITARNTTRGVIITLCNYEDYQNINNYKYSSKTQQETQPKTQGKHRENTTINNNVKNEKNKDSKALESPHLINQAFKEAWDGWLEMRTKIKAPNTHRALQLTLKELNKYKVEIAIAMVEQSTMRGWRGVFPLKNGTVKKHYPWNDLK